MMAVNGQVDQTKDENNNSKVDDGGLAPLVSQG